MKQLRYVDQVWFVGDSTADVLLDLAAALAKAGSAEHVALRVLDINGAPTEIEFLLGPATMMTAEHATDEFAVPDNVEIEGTMKARMLELDSAP